VRSPHAALPADHRAERVKKQVDVQEHGVAQNKLKRKSFVCVDERQTRKRKKNSVDLFAKEMFVASVLWKKNLKAKRGMSLSLFYR
jgi:hypothetical protein